jgi:hypothetical protein
MSVVLAEKYNVMVKSEELIGTTESDTIYEVSHKLMLLMTGFDCISSSFLPSKT